MKNTAETVSLMVAILMVCSVLTIHASATWYEYTLGGIWKNFQNYYRCYGEVSDNGDLFVSAWTESSNSEHRAAEVGLSWITNVSPEFDPESDIDYSVDNFAYASIDTNAYIACDYEVISFTSSHTVYDVNGIDSETFFIGTSE